MHGAKLNEFIYDVYSERWIRGIVGALTANGNTSFTHCGTFLVVVEKNNGENENKSFRNV